MSSSGTIDDDGFTQVKSKRKSRRSKYVVKEKTVDDYFEDLTSKSEILKSSNVFQTLIVQLEKLNIVQKRDFHENEQKKDDILSSIIYPQKRITSVKCLALGSPTDSHVAMYQLGLLRNLLEYLNLSSSIVTCWDPVFSKEDENLFSKLGYQVVNPDDPKKVESCKDEEEQLTDQNSKLETDVKSITLYYMIHSPPSLTNSILSMNENQGGDIVVIGNNLITYSNHLSDAELADKYPFISDAIKDIESAEKDNSEKVWEFFPIPDRLSKNDAWMTAVNDLAIYWKRFLVIEDNKI